MTGGDAGLPGRGNCAPSGSQAAVKGHLCQQLVPRRLWAIASNPNRSPPGQHECLGPASSLTAVCWEQACQCSVATGRRCDFRTCLSMAASTAARGTGDGSASPAHEDERCPQGPYEPLPDSTCSLREGRRAWSRRRVTLQPRRPHSLRSWEEARGDRDRAVGHWKEV